jgi:hypothetical protein
MKRLALIASAFVLITICRAGGERASGLPVTHLPCEYLTNPVGIDALETRLSRMPRFAESHLRVAAPKRYQIIVAKVGEELSAEQEDV